MVIKKPSFTFDLFVQGEFCRIFFHIIFNTFAFFFCLYFSPCSDLPFFSLFTSSFIVLFLFLLHFAFFLAVLFMFPSIFSFVLLNLFLLKFRSLYFPYLLVHLPFFFWFSFVFLLFLLSFFCLLKSFLSYSLICCSLSIFSSVYVSLFDSSFYRSSFVSSLSSFFSFSVSPFFESFDIFFLTL